MDQVLLNKAAAFMLEAHKNQKRKNGPPYFIHPMDVFSMTASWGFHDDNIGAASLLHDTIEDTGTTHKQLADLFGNKIANIVQELTFVPNSQHVILLGSVKTQKANYLATFKDASVEALIVKVADRICNVEDFYSSHDLEYAGLYCKKAGPLFQIMLDRYNEITKAYGWGPYDAMKHQWWETHQKVRKY